MKNLRKACPPCLVYATLIVLGVSMAATLYAIATPLPSQQFRFWALLLWRFFILQAHPRGPPIIVHCSAGIGRTGESSNMYIIYTCNYLRYTIMILIIHYILYVVVHIIIIKITFLCMNIIIPKLCIHA